MLPTKMERINVRETNYPLRFYTNRNLYLLTETKALQGFDRNHPFWAAVFSGVAELSTKQETLGK